MPITVASNIASLNAQRQLGKTSESLSATYERLSSGLRINRASDDAAGLSIALSLQTDARVYTQGIRNLNDGLSFLNIADGSLEQLNHITQRQLELAEQAANGTYSVTQRVSLNSEINALSSEYNRILGSMSFNGVNVFSSSVRTSGLSLQVGQGDASVLTSYIGANGSRDVGTGTFNSPSAISSGQSYISMMETADFNGDGYQDVIASLDGSGSIKVSFGTSSGSLSAGTEVANTGVNNHFLRVGDFNGDGVKDFAISTQTEMMSVYIGTGSGAFTLGMSSTDAGFNGDGFDVADVNGDGRDDIVQSGLGAGRVYLGNSNGSFSVGATFSIGYSSGSSTVKLIKDRLSNNYSAVFVSRSNGTSIINLGSSGTPQGTLQTIAGADSGRQISTGDFDGDGVGDFVLLNNAENSYRVYMGNGNGTFRLGQTFAGTTGGGYIGTGLRSSDLNGDGIFDLIQTSSSGIITYAGNGDGTFASGVTATSLGSTSTLALGDFNRDGVLDVVSNDGGFSDGNIKLSLANTTKTLTTKRFDITSQGGAREALTFLNTQLSNVALERGSIGAFMSRINIAASNATETRNNYLASASRIADADIAKESAELIRLRILQNVGASVLAQANQQPGLVLELLKL